MTDLDEELKRVRLKREKLALQEDERRAARRQQAEHLAKTVVSTTVSTTREVGGATLRIGAAVGWCVVFGVLAAIAMVLFAAAGDLAGVGQDFAFRFGFYLQRYFLIGVLVIVGAGVWCFYRFFRNRI